MANALRWGIMGTGNIARQFVAGMISAHRAKTIGVGSRSLESASNFAKTASIPNVHGNYEALLSDRDIDAVYISLPNSMHHEWTIKALRAGKHVLCEKPIAVNASQAEEMFDVSQKTGKVLVEAFMYRAHPQTQAILDSIRSGTIGQVKIIKTSFCFRIAKVGENIRFNPGLAGGSLMDVGCYCLGFCRLIAGQEPDRIFATGNLHPNGVDEWAAGALHFPSGTVASFVSGMTVQADNTAYICGSEGYLEIPIPWKPQRKSAFSISYSTPPKQDAKGGAVPQRPPKQEISVESHAELYALEGDAMAATVLDGAPPMVSPQDSIGNMRVLDEMRRQVGLPY